MRLRLSKFALEDIERIYDYTAAEWGAEQALKYIHGLWDALEEIQRSPERWRHRHDIYADARACVSGRHLIIYRVREQRIEVSRILHGSMHLPSHVPPDFIDREGPEQ